MNHYYISIVHPLNPKKGFYLTKGANLKYSTVEDKDKAEAFLLSAVSLIGLVRQYGELATISFIPCSLA